MFYFTAIALGVLSSFHCVGMCGPIALAAPVVRGSAFSELWSRLLYHAGRSTSYLVIGLLAGTAGSGLYMAGYQQALAIGAGAMILLWAVLPRLNPENWGLIQKLSFLRSIRHAMGTLFRRKTYGAAYEIGILNGMLPCAMVYMAVAGAVTTGDILKGGLYMLCFSAGTLPLMFALTAAWKWMTLSRQKTVRKFLPVLLGLVGCLMIIRGLNLGIPYLSPSFERQGTETISVCGKNTL